jgi:hypothetical protein
VCVGGVCVCGCSGLDSHFLLDPSNNKGTDTYTGKEFF